MSAFTARARLAGLTAHRKPDDPAIEEARRDLAVENLVTHIKRVIPLTAAERDRLALELHPDGGGADAA